MNLQKRYWIEKRCRNFKEAHITIVTLLDGEKYLELGTTHTQYAGEENLHPLSYIIKEPCYYSHEELERDFQDVTEEYLDWRHYMYGAMERAHEVLQDLEKYWSYKGSNMCDVIAQKLARRV